MAIKHGLRAQNYTCPLENHIILLGTSKVQSQLSFWLLKSVIFSNSRLINFCRPFSASLLYINTRALGLPWWSSGWDVVLPTQGARVWSLVRELRSYAMLCSQINQSIKLLIEKIELWGQFPAYQSAPPDGGQVPPLSDPWDLRGFLQLWFQWDVTLMGLQISWESALLYPSLVRAAKKLDEPSKLSGSSEIWEVDEELAAWRMKTGGHFWTSPNTVQPQFVSGFPYSCWNAFPLPVNPLYPPD